MRFLMLNWRDPRNPKSGGAERVTLAYMKALRERGHEVFWFSNSFPGCTREEDFEGIKVLRGGGKGSSVLHARNWYRTQKPFDLVIDQHHGLPWYAPWWCKTNCVAYIHEVLGPIWNAFYSWPLNDLGRIQERWTFRLYKDVPFWTPSESTRQELYRNRVRNVTVLPNGSDTQPLPNLDLKPFCWPVRLIVVSRLEANKRVDHAIQALLELHQRGIEGELTIVGNGDMADRLRELASNSRIAAHVHFAGHVDESQKNFLLERSHLLLHTSIREGWGLNVIEANAMGTPAVVYPVGGLVDSTVNGQTGIVTQSETPASLAQAIADLLAEPERYDRFRRQAWERAKGFEWRAVLPLACDFLESQAGFRRGTAHVV